MCDVYVMVDEDVYDDGYVMVYVMDMCWMMMCM